jgi:hypothetical protein
MRGSKLQGRFNLDYESKRIYESIKEDLQHPVGVDVDWFRWSEDYMTDNRIDIVDDIYDVSSSITNKGRRWALPFNMPCVTAQLVRGSNEMNERGFYIVDTLRIVLNVGDVQRLLPDILVNPDKHIKDRILYRGNVFTPTRVLPRGHFGYYWSVVTIDCTEVNADELVNDPQFKQYALKATKDWIEPDELGYGAGQFGMEGYGR